MLDQVEEQFLKVRLTVLLKQGDGAAANGEKEISIRGVSSTESEVLLFDMA